MCIKGEYVCDLYHFDYNEMLNQEPKKEIEELKKKAKGKQIPELIKLIKSSDIIRGNYICQVIIGILLFNDAVKETKLDNFPSIDLIGNEYFLINKTHLSKFLDCRKTTIDTSIKSNHFKCHNSNKKDKKEISNLLKKLIPYMKNIHSKQWNMIYIKKSLNCRKDVGIQTIQNQQYQIHFPLFSLYEYDTS